MDLKALLKEISFNTKIESLWLFSYYQQCRFQLLNYILKKKKSLNVENYFQ